MCTRDVFSFSFLFPETSRSRLAPQTREFGPASPGLAPNWMPPTMHTRFGEFPSGTTEAFLCSSRLVGGTTFIAVLLRGLFNDYLLLRCEVTRLICVCPTTAQLLLVDEPIDEVSANMWLLHALWDQDTGRNVLFFHMNGDRTSYIMTCEFHYCVVVYSFGP